MDDNVGAFRRGDHRTRISGVHLDDLGTGSRARSRTASYQTRDPPSGHFEGMRRCTSELPGSAKHDNTTAHDGSW